MRRAQGFTLIELSLAMTFVSILLISIAMLSIQLTNQYSRGMTLKEVAQAGTEVSNDIKRTMVQSQLSGAGVRTKAISGGGTVLCTNSYSYIANNPANLEADNGNVIRVGGSGSPVAVRLAKVRDSNGTLCSTPSQLDTTKTYVTTDFTELLAGGSRKLVVREMTAVPSGLSLDGNGVPNGGLFYQEYQKGRAIYTVRLTIGTGVESELASNTSCRAPKDLQSNLEFCAIDTFEFTTRVGSSNRQ